MEPPGVWAVSGCATSPATTGFRLTSTTRRRSRCCFGRARGGPCPTTAHCCSRPAQRARRAVPHLAAPALAAPCAARLLGGWPSDEARHSGRRAALLAARAARGSRRRRRGRQRQRPRLPGRGAVDGARRRPSRLGGRRRAGRPNIDRWYRGRFPMVAYALCGLPARRACAGPRPGRRDRRAAPRGRCRPDDGSLAPTALDSALRDLRRWRRLGFRRPRRGASGAPRGTGR